MTELFQDEFDTDKSKRFHVLEKLGSGSFGEVRKAIDSISGQYVALKYISILSQKDGIPKAVFREMESLKQLSDSRYIIKLFDVFTTESKLCLVMEYIDSNVAEMISAAPTFFSRPQFKCFSKMILGGIYYCHQRHVIHRDIKPANLLVTSRGSIKLADFGLARVVDVATASNDTNGAACKLADLSHQVSTRWYRAPELLFASRTYDLSVDIWSCAVVLAELLSLLPLFPGNNDIDQMYKVFQIMGSPTESVWPGVSSLPDYSKVSFPNMVPLDLHMLLPNAHPRDIQFLQTMLSLDPKKRHTASQAFHSEYLNSELPYAIEPHMALSISIKRFKDDDSGKLKVDSSSSNETSSSFQHSTFESFVDMCNNEFK